MNHQDAPGTRTSPLGNSQEKSTSETLEKNSIKSTPCNLIEVIFETCKLKQKTSKSITFYNDIFSQVLRLAIVMIEMSAFCLWFCKSVSLSVST